MILNCGEVEYVPLKNAPIDQLLNAKVFTKVQHDESISDMIRAYWDPDRLNAICKLGQTQQALTNFLRRNNVPVSRPLIPVQVQGYKAPVFMPLDKRGPTH